MVAVPPGLPVGTVAGRFLFVSQDQADADTNADYTVISGTVKFTCSTKKPIQVSSQNLLIVPLVFQATFDSEGYLVPLGGNAGTRGLELPASNSTFYNPSGFTWRVEFDIRDASSGNVIKVDPFNISVLEGVVTYLSDVIPVDESKGITTLRGVQGTSLTNVTSDATIPGAVVFFFSDNTTRNVDLTPAIRTAVGAVTEQDVKTYMAPSMALKMDASQKGAVSGVAPLGADSKVPYSNLPTRLGELDSTFVKNTAIRNRVALAGAPSGDWFQRSRHGMFVHYTYGGATHPQTIRRDATVPASVSVLGAEFDAVKFAADVASFGVEYVIFTAWHYGMHVLYPSAVMNGVMAGHASDTDVIQKLIDALKPRGIKLVLYVHATDGMDLSAAEQTATGWTDATNNYAVWQNFINNLLTEMGQRYGTDLDGVWVDAMPTPDFATKIADLPRFRRSLQAGHPRRVLIGNQGTNDNDQPSKWKNVVDYMTREYMSPPASVNDWIAGYSHLAAIPLKTGEWWAIDPQGGASVMSYTPAEMFRFSVLQAGTSRYSGGMSWAVSPYAGTGATSLWEDGVEQGMKDLAALLEPIKDSLKGTIASTSFLTPNTVTLNTLTAYVATQSADGTVEYIHVLKPPAGKTLTLPAPSDGATFSTAMNVATGRSVQLSPLADGGYTLTLDAADTWSATDTAISMTRTLKPGEIFWVGASEWGTTNGATYLPQGVASRYPAWSLSDTVNQSVQASFVLPPMWNTFDMELYWSQSAAGVGDAVLTITRAEAVSGGNMAVDDLSFAGTQTLPGVASILKTATVIQGLRSKSGAINHARIQRTADTAGDTGPASLVLGILLRRTS